MAGRGRGRPRTSDDDKKATREAAEAKKYDPRTAIAKMFKDKDKTVEEFITKPKQLASDAAEAAAEVGAHKNRVLNLTGTDPIVYGFIQRLSKVSTERSARCLRQVNYLAGMLGFDAQGDLPLDEPGSEADSAPVFDKTATGAKQKRTTSKPPKEKPQAAPPVDTGVIPLDEARKKFEENKANAEAKRAARKAAKTPANANAPSGKEYDPSMEKGEAEKQAELEALRKQDAAEFDKGGGEEGDGPLNPPPGLQDEPSGRFQIL